MGFLKNMFDDGYTQDRIDNRPQTVTDRLTYLRLSRDDDFLSFDRGDFYTDYRTVTTPRTIEYQIKGLSYFLARESSDLSRYLLTDEERLAIITGYAYSHYEQDAKSDVKKTYLYDTKSEGRDIVIPLKTIWDSEDPFVVPDDVVEALALSPKGRKGVAKNAILAWLPQMSWKEPAPGDLECATDIWDGGTMPRYKYVHCLRVDIWINGYPVDKQNLTLTEQYQLQEMILAEKTRGNFISDGKEDRDIVSKLLSTRYRKMGVATGFNLGPCSEANFSLWYGKREVALANARREHEEALKEQTREETKSKTVRRQYG